MSDDLKDAPLGQTSAYITEYDPSLLYPIARSANRASLDLDEDDLPFEGEDEWQAFELSWLTPTGKPVVAIARFRVPASSSFLIESKSWKLYLNSFNQTRFASSVEVRRVLRQDLSRVVDAEVEVTLFGVDDIALAPGRLPGICLDDLDVEVDTYQPDPELIITDSDIIEETVHSHLLKSNCPVTGQPDWGSVLIRYRGPALDHHALLAYIISFREHQEFHEHCVERMFMDILREAEPDQLLVMARYVRRGGLDISPWRALPGETPIKTMRLMRQ
ncbi:NADPH-dependent 7-cyano-7-deazaguanine reductase [Kushneria pakistanensis]|uniref:NADPH-dependent 7-cyano-7-deazaguanine reductase n=1 Tax=Kushneria pakistanensis TaxID=1508770 RepID=A0ABQ3FP34_9GAMM|nr:NADPH-dependent 7-cyano-7-deazaguanine reductase QueF [Kushneria pakistanensis]GHC31062.1 NADPH-dependent 7-cyano-7-deazaguanine reductase [Kushneria pakistanensis]